METFPHSDSIPTRLPVTSTQFDGTEVVVDALVVSITAGALVLGDSVTDTIAGVDPGVEEPVEAVPLVADCIEEGGAMTDAGGRPGLLPHPASASNTTAAVAFRR